MQNAAVVSFLGYFEKWTMFYSFFPPGTGVHDAQTVAAPSQLCVFCHKVLVPGLWCCVVVSDCSVGWNRLCSDGQWALLLKDAAVGGSQGQRALCWAAPRPARAAWPQGSGGSFSVWANPRVLLSLLWCLPTVLGHVKILCMANRTGVTNAPPPSPASHHGVVPGTTQAWVALSSPPVSYGERLRRMGPQFAVRLLGEIQTTYRFTCATSFICSQSLHQTPFTITPWTTLPLAISLCLI